MSTGLNKKNKWSIEVDGVSKTGYEWKQTMRRLETEARKSREQITLAKAAGNKDLEKKYRKRLRAINTKYNSIADATGIKAQPEKLRVFGKTVGKLDDKNIVEKSEKSGIIKSNDKKYVGSIFENSKYNPSDIQEAILQEGTNFVTKDVNNPEYDYGVAIESVPKLPNVYDIKAHGDYDGVKIFDSAVDASELARIILSRNDYNGETIRLLSCNTGKVVNDTCAAQELADLLGVDVIAPNDIISTDGKGLLRIGDNRFTDTGKFVRFKPK